MYEIARVEAEIRCELARVNSLISNLRHESLPEELQGGGDNTPLSEGADARRAAAERDLQDEQLRRLYERAAGLEHALERIQKGSYGMCADCGQPIHPARLRALPEVDVCLQCAAHLEK